MRYDILFASARLILAPSRTVIEVRKRKLSPADAGNLNLKWNYCFFKYAVALFLVLACLDGTPIGLNRGVVLVISLLSFSRCNEIIFAFGMDGLDQLNTAIKKSSFTKIEKMRFLILSFIELIINFSFIHYSVKILSPGQSYYGNLCSLFNAFYFSVITITTTGYGDTYPISMPARIVCMHEILSGIVLIIFAFTIYGSLGSEKNRHISKYRLKRRSSARNRL